MLMSLLGKGELSLNSKNSANYKKTVQEFQKKISTLRLGYVPGIIRHYYHGSKKNRQYTERWKILVEHHYQPSVHVTYDEKGLLIPTNEFPEQLKKDIMKYFSERNEDEK